MKLAVFGATGDTGRELTAQAVEADHEIKTLTRSPARLPADGPVTKIEGNVLDREAVEVTLVGTDAVVCLLGRTANNPDDVVSRGTENIIEAMEGQDLSRLIVLTSMGLGASIRQVPWYVRIANATVLHNLMADKARQEELVASSSLDWTLVRPGGLTNGSRTGAYVHGVDVDVMAGPISRADVAEFLLTVVQNHTYLRQTPVITTRKSVTPQFLWNQVLTVTRRLLHG